MDPANGTHGLKWRQWKGWKEDGGEGDAAVGTDDGEYIHEPLGEQADCHDVDVEDGADEEGADV